MSNTTIEAEVTTSILEVQIAGDTVVTGGDTVRVIDGVTNANTVVLETTSVTVIDTTNGAGASGTPTSHSRLTGLSEDDHAQYHNNIRGDARYYREDEHVAAAAGAADAGKPILLDADGHVDATMLNDSDVDHGALTGLADDDHTQYLRADGSRTLTGNALVDALITIDGRDLSVDGAKLDGVEALADVTDATNVEAAGAVMDADVIDDDTMVTASDTTVSTSESLVAYIATSIASQVVYKGSYNAATDVPDLSAGTGLKTGWMYTVTVAGNAGGFWTTALEVGDVIIVEQDNPTLESHYTVVNKDLDAASIKASYEANADTNAFTDAEQTLLGDQSGTNTGDQDLEDVRAVDNQLAGNIDFNNNSIDNLNALAFQGGESITWNSDDHTIDVPTGDGPTVQVGQELVVRVYNNTGAAITDGAIVYLDNGNVTNGRFHVKLARAESHVTSKDVFVATMEIPDGSEGFCTKQGRVRGIDTSSFSVGDVLWLSETIAGELTNVRPEFPSYGVKVGTALTSAVSGDIAVDITAQPTSTIVNFHNGTFREHFDFFVTSDGTTITGSLSPSGSQENLTMLFSDGFTILDTTPAKTITLIAGSATVPAINRIYIPVATKVLTVSTSGWPTTEHIKVAKCQLLTAAITQAQDALTNQNMNDGIQDYGQGHLTHITKRLRREGTKWLSGTEGSASIVTSSTPDDVYVAITGGVVSQLHEHTVPAQDMSTGDHAYVVNHSSAPYTSITNLNTQLLDAQGGSLNNTSFSFVVWGVANKTGETDHLMVNLPTNSYSYTAITDAIADPNGYSTYSIPAAFTGTGFLIARFTVTYKNDVWTLEDTEDLRGSIPNISAGGGVGGAGVTTFLGLTDTPSAYSGLGGYVTLVNAAETALELTSSLNGIAVGDVTPSTGAFTTLSASGTLSAVAGSWDVNGINVLTGDAYSINDVNVLTATTLGGTVINSSLTQTGALNSGSITSGFGAIDIGSSTMSSGNNTITGADPKVNIGNTGISTGSAVLELGNSRTGSGYAYIDLVGDTTYSDYGLRLMRLNTGANADSRLIHRGAGNLKIETTDTGDLQLLTSESVAVAVNSNQDVGIGETSPAARLHVKDSVASIAVLETTDTTANAPRLKFYKNTSSPAASDQALRIGASINNSIGVDTEVAFMYVPVPDVTDGSEDARFVYLTMVAGSIASRLIIGGGLYHSAASGGDKGNNTINFGAVYDDGTLLTCIPFAAWNNNGVVDLDYWDSQVLNAEIPDEYETRPVLDVDGAVVLDGTGTPVSEEILVNPAHTVTKTHGPARLLKARLDHGFDGAGNFDASVTPLSLDWQIDHVKTKGHFSSFPNPEKWMTGAHKGKKSLGASAASLQEAQELNFIYIAELREKINKLENQLNLLLEK